MTKPTTVPTFATSGSAVRVSPTAATVLDGWEPGQALTEGAHNYWWNLQGEWFAYLDGTDFVDDTLARLKWDDGTEDGHVLINSSGTEINWNGSSYIGTASISDSTFGAFKSIRAFICGAPATGGGNEGHWYGYDTANGFPGRWEVGAISRGKDWITTEDIFANVAGLAVQPSDSITYGAANYLVFSRSSGSDNFACFLPLQDLARSYQSSRDTVIRIERIFAEVGAGFSHGVTQIKVGLVQVDKPSGLETDPTMSIVQSVNTGTPVNFTTTLTAGGGGGTYDTAVISTGAAYHVDLDPSSFDYFVIVFGVKTATAAAGAFRRIFLDVQKFAVE